MFLNKSQLIKEICEDENRKTKCTKVFEKQNGAMYFKGKPIITIKDLMNVHRETAKEILESIKLSRKKIKVGGK